MSAEKQDGKDQKPKPKNLLKNGSLRPKSDWEGNICKDIDFAPWEIIENGGDGIVLEKSPSGTDVGPLPSAPGYDQHCIATSKGWFKRRQTIGLLENGIVPHFYDNPNLMIYICEWFASRTDNEGQYFMRVCLLNENHEEIPGYSYNTDTSRAYDDEWDHVEYTFFPVPETTRYVRFEDGGRDSESSDGQFGVKMFGASVYAGQKEEKEDGCVVM